MADTDEIDRPLQSSSPANESFDGLCKPQEIEIGNFGRQSREDRVRAPSQSEYPFHESFASGGTDDVNA